MWLLPDVAGCRHGWDPAAVFLGSLHRLWDLCPYCANCSARSSFWPIVMHGSWLCGVVQSRIGNLRRPGFSGQYHSNDCVIVSLCKRPCMLIALVCLVITAMLPACVAVGTYLFWHRRVLQGIWPEGNGLIYRWLSSRESSRLCVSVWGAWSASRPASYSPSCITHLQAGCSKQR